MAKPGFITEKMGADTYLLSNSFTGTDKLKSAVHLLPALDEYLISYKDRSPSLQVQHQSKAFSINGIFRPIIVINGQVTGLWKRSFKKGTVYIETDFFNLPSEAAKKQVEKAAKLFGRFLGKKVSVVHSATE